MKPAPRRYYVRFDPVARRYEVTTERWSGHIFDTGPDGRGFERRHEAAREARYQNAQMKEAWR